MTRVVRFVANPVLAARECLLFQDAWWRLAARAVEYRRLGYPDIARFYAECCRKLIEAIGKPTARLEYPTVPERSSLRRSA